MCNNSLFGDVKGRPGGGRGASGWRHDDDDDDET